MSFWFPAVWTLRDRSVVAGMLWNSTQERTGNDKDDAGLIRSVVAVSSIDCTDNNHMTVDLTGNHRSSNLSDVKYSYNETIL